jgi:hypothetical protein
MSENHSNEVSITELQEAIFSGTGLSHLIESNEKFSALTVHTIKRIISASKNSSEEFFITLASIPYFDLEPARYGKIVRLICSKFEQLGELFEKRKKILSDFSKITTHDKCKSNFLKFVQYYFCHRHELETSEEDLDSDEESNSEEEFAEVEYDSNSHDDDSAMVESGSEVESSEVDSDSDSDSNVSTDSDLDSDSASPRQNLYVYLMETISLQASITPDYHQILTDYMNSESPLVVINLATKEMIDLWVKIREETKLRENYSVHYLKSLISVTPSADGLYDVYLEEDLAELLVLLEYFECEQYQPLFLTAHSLAKASRRRVCERLVSYGMLGESNQLKIMNLLSSSFLGKFLTQDWPEACWVFRLIMDHFVVYDPRVKEIMPKFVSELVCGYSKHPEAGCGFSRAKNATLERRELLDCLWKYDKECFLIAFDKVQEHYILESRIYDYQVAEYFKEKSFYITVDLFVLFRLSQNSLIPITDKVYESLLNSRQYSGSDDAMFASLVDSQKTIDISTDKNLAKSAISAWVEVFACDGFSHPYWNPVLYEIGRLAGYLFSDESESFNFIDIPDAPDDHPMLSFFLGYLDKVPRNEYLLTNIFSLITDMHRNENFNEWKVNQSDSCNCHFMLKLIKLNHRQYFQQLLYMLPTFCCFQNTKNKHKRRMRNCLTRILLAEINSAEPVVTFDNSCLGAIQKCSMSDDDDILFLSILVDRWRELSEEAKVEISSKSDALPKELLIQIGLTGYSTDFLMRGVECLVFRSEALPVFERVKSMNLEESARLKVASHWLFVDQFEDISNFWSLSVLVNLAI